MEFTSPRRFYGRGRPKATEFRSEANKAIIELQKSAPSDTGRWFTNIRTIDQRLKESLDVRDNLLAEITQEPYNIAREDRPHDYHDFSKKKIDRALYDFSARLNTAVDNTHRSFASYYGVDQDVRRSNYRIKKAIGEMNTELSEILSEHFYEDHTNQKLRTFRNNLLHDSIHYCIVHEQDIPESRFAPGTGYFSAALDPVEKDPSKFYLLFPELSSYVGVINFMDDLYIDTEQAIIHTFKKAAQTTENESPL